MGRPEGPHARRRPEPPARPRYGRIAAAAGALLVTVVAVLGGAGLLPVEHARASVSAGRPASAPPAAKLAAQSAAQSRLPGSTPVGDGGALRQDDLRLPASSKPAADRSAGQQVAPAVPADSGSGRRIVFDITSQRVWLVGRHAGHDVVRRTYLVSGSVTDNLQPGTYSVYSRSLHAWGVDDSGTMRYMVRFAHGAHAAIGFHDIPRLHGAYLQTRDQLGSPQSHGCIRQWRPDAKALWAFAPVGTEVDVVA